ncbi:MAG: hypothetical protein ACKOBH_06340 [bacterium]
MSSPAEPRYGTPNWEMLSGWFDLPKEDDGPFWAINLMKYRAIADYADGRETTLTGREADDLYAPFGPIEAVGGMVAFGADVSSQLSGSPEYDRVAIVRYPSRAAFFEMQRREDFQELHLHKDAGMESTIVMACRPRSTDSAQPEDDESLLVRVRGSRVGSEATEDFAGLAPVARFEVEGVIIGDGSDWNEVLLDLVTASDLEEVAATSAIDDQISILLAQPVIDELVQSIQSADG